LPNRYEEGALGVSQYEHRYGNPGFNIHLFNRDSRAAPGPSGGQQPMGRLTQELVPDPM